jgi:hypothetical protein
MTSKQIRGFVASGEILSERFSQAGLLSNAANSQSLQYFAYNIGNTNLTALQIKESFDHVMLRDDAKHRRSPTQKKRLFEDVIDAIILEPKFADEAKRLYRAQDPHTFLRRTSSN